MKTLISIRELPYAESTLRFGSLIAGLDETSVTLMTVVGNREKESVGRERLERARELLGAPKVKTRVRRGSPAKQILKESTKRDYDLIVVGARDVRRLFDTLFSSIPHKVAGRAPVSVLVVKNGQAQLGRILVCYSGNAMTQDVVKMGAFLARPAGVAVTVLYVADPVPSMFTGLGGIEETLEELLQTDTPVAQCLRWSAQYLAEKGVPAEIELRHGVVADEILREAHERDYDLIVMGAQAETGLFKRALVDEVAVQVSDRAPTSGLIVNRRPNGTNGDA